jgi:uncharacterized cupin superfamily protein
LAIGKEADMSLIKIERPSAEKLKELGVFSWPIWEKEVSKFDWHYDEQESCYLLKGKVTVTTKGGEKAEFGAGDFVVFPQGLNCVWDIQEAVRKHYNFG